MEQSKIIDTLETYHPDGTLLGVEGKLGNTDMCISSFVTDLM